MSEVMYLAPILIYVAFEAVYGLWVKEGNQQPTYQLSHFERMAFRSDESIISVIIPMFGLASRVNGIGMLVYLAVYSVWWHALVVWVCGALLGGVLIQVVKLIFRYGGGLQFLSMACWLVLPATGSAAWFLMLTTLD